MEIKRAIAGETLTFLPEKAVYWPRRQTLMVADLHWGKAETFQKAGIPVSSQVLGEDLSRLAQLLETTGAQRVIILGDLLHGPQALTKDIEETVAAWRRDRTVQLILVAGNHDQKSPPLPPTWEIETVPREFEDAGFRFTHAPPSSASSSFYTWCGHLHPMLRLSRRGDQMRLPCFWLRPNYAVLPSFGSFTGGLNIEAGPRDKVILIAGGEVIAYDSEN